MTDKRFDLLGPMGNPMEQIQRIIEEQTSKAFDDGFTAGKQATEIPWQGMGHAPKDGSALLLGLGTVRVIGHWHRDKGSWVQQGTGRAVLPMWWMPIPPTPKM